MLTEVVPLKTMKNNYSYTLFYIIKIEKTSLNDYIIGLNNKLNNIFFITNDESFFDIINNQKVQFNDVEDLYALPLCKEFYTLNDMYIMYPELKQCNFIPNTINNSNIKNETLVLAQCFIKQNTRTKLYLFKYYNNSFYIYDYHLNWVEISIAQDFNLIEHDLSIVNICELNLNKKYKKCNNCEKDYTKCECLGGGPDNHYTWSNCYNI